MAQDNPPINYSIRPMTMQELYQDALQKTVGTPAVRQLKYDQLPEGFGESRYDTPEEGIPMWATEDLNEWRAFRQPTAAKWGSGLAKFGVYTGTTFVGNAVGLYAGIINAIAEGDINKFVDNPVNEAMNNIQQKSEEWFPNYYSKKERETPFALGSANFWADKFLKNLGFTAGSMLSMYVSPFNAIKGISTAAKTTKMLLNGAFAATGESSMEAFNAVREYDKNADLIKRDAETRRQQLADLYGSSAIEDPRAAQAFQADLQRINDAEARALEKINQDRNSMMNMVWGENMIWLTASNMLQFPRLLTGGYRTARQMSNALVRDGKVIARKASAAGRAAKNVGTEAAEEIGQEIFSRSSESYYADKLLKYYAHDLNPDYNEQSVDFATNFWNSTKDALSDPFTWEQGFIGALTGAMGHVSVGKAAEDSDMPLFNGKLGLNAGIIGEIGATKRENARREEIANRANAVLQTNPKLQAIVRGLNQHFGAQDDMNKAILDGNIKEYKDAEWGQLISDIGALHDAGLLDMYKTQIRNYISEVSDDELKSLSQQMSQLDDNNQETNPFASMSTEEQRKFLKDNLDKINDAIDLYKKIRQDIDMRSGEHLTNEHLSELTWMKAKIVDANKRKNQLRQEIIDTATTYRNKVQENLSAFEAKNPEAKKVKEAQDQLKSIDEFINDIKNNRFDAKKFNQIVKDIQENDENEIKDEETFNPFSQKVHDFAALANDVMSYNILFSAYLLSDEKLDQAHELAKKREADKANKKRIADVVKKYQDAKTEDEKDDVYRTAKSDEKQAIKKAETNSDRRDYLRLLDDKDAIKKAFNDIIDNNPQITDDVLREHTKAVFANVIQRARRHSDIMNPWLVVNDVDHGGTADETVKVLIENALAEISARKAFANSFGRYVPRPKGGPAAQSTGADPVSYYPTPTPPPTVGAAAPTNVSQEDEDEAYNPAASSNPEFIEPATLENRAESTSSIIPSIPYFDINLWKDQGLTGKDRVYDEFWKSRMKQALAQDDNFKHVSDEVLKKYDENLDPATATDEQRIEAYIAYIESTGVMDFPNRHNEKGKEAYDKMVSLTPESIAQGTYRGYYDIWKTLENIGAFKYVDDGKLKLSDKVYFGFSKHFGDLVVMAVRDGKNYQIVGVVNENQKDLYDYMYTLTNKLDQASVTSDYFTHMRREDKSDNFSTVSHIYNGTLKYVDDEHLIGNTPYKIGIVDQHHQITGAGLDDKVRIDSDAANKIKEGTPVLLVPNANGIYFPVPVRTKPFNADTLAEANDINASIDAIVKKIVRAPNISALNSAVSKLKELLYIPKGVIRIQGYGVTDQGREYELEKDSRDRIAYIGIADIAKDKEHQAEFHAAQEAGEEHVRTQSSLIKIPLGDNDEEAAAQLKSVLVQYVTHYNIRQSLVNTADWNAKLGTSVVTTNIDGDIRIIGGFFSVGQFDPKTKRFAIDEKFKPAPTPRKDSSNRVTEESMPLSQNVQIVKRTETLNNRPKVSYYLKFADGQLDNIDNIPIPVNVAPDGNQLSLSAAEYYAARQRALYAPENQKVKGQKVSWVKTGTRWYAVNEQGDLIAANDEYSKRLDAHALAQAAQPAPTSAPAQSATPKATDELNTGVWKKLTQNSTFKTRRQDAVIDGQIVKDLYVVSVWDGEESHKNNRNLGLTVYNGHVYFVTLAGRTLKVSENISQKLKDELASSKGYGFAINDSYPGLTYFYRGGYWLQKEYIDRIEEVKNSPRVQDVLDQQAAQTGATPEPTATPESLSSPQPQPAPQSDPLQAILNETRDTGIPALDNPQPQPAPQSEATMDSDMSDMMNIGSDRVVSDSSLTGTIDVEKEVAWLQRVLPQLSKEECIKIHDDIAQIKGNAPYVWGHYVNGVKHIAKNSAKGSLFHEAFHDVMDRLLTYKEKKALLNEARQRYGEMPDKQLEEMMAEEFADYTSSLEYDGKVNPDVKPKGAIKKLFDRIVAWVKAILNLEGSVWTINDLYARINAGEFKNRVASTPSGESSDRQVWTDEMREIRQKAIADGTFMKAPNGKPTNLNEWQWLVVRTKAFKDWFGDWTKITFDKDGKVLTIPNDCSNVIDENGEPLVVYHGNRTDSKITAFDLSKKGSEHKEREISGFWFVDNAEIAKYEYAFKTESWGTGNPQFGEVLGVFLNIKNPVVAKQDIKEEMSPYGLMQYSKERLDDFIHTAKLRQTNNTDGFILTMLDSDGSADFEQSKQTQFVVFNPNQIKSATDNITFNNEDNRIYDEDPKYMHSSVANLNSLPTSIQQQLAQEGFTQEMWNDLTDEQRENILFCL